ncbi:MULTISPECIES: acyltransferase [unclassified Curtobacterium]|uniref:acyltransferase n=1 Tax=unclassified Curtobacterium TaxID=257496 RepID=UPI000F47FCD5|nr:MULTISPECIES: acyltransferase [unclassified Curtobacterium]ROQ07560.1 surface polysaccharide O-acyltransferase-like enzyme [Curtobacterium sp. PhB171]ROQ23829.1 surface polysaccharide O-acyltransferase-like enzyme [Curtobacterium sp. PhB170]ROS35743.1 surface polysaccharide O-acyltransferase-like enzyme [Curtobacterium sp. PhB131]ROS69852.1 surface polysaccharide O-acyltransferase-like enzyme [Curtobacterium sp. PhB141]
MTGAQPQSQSQPQAQPQPQPQVQTPTRTAAGKPRHLYEVDVLRILTFACVIGVHTTSHTAASDDVGLNALLALLHFTRLVFFSLTAFVLVYSYTLRPRPMAQFWPKRFLLVGVPYLAWSFVYVGSSWLLSSTRRGDVPDLVRTLAEGIVTGSSWYHLYFLLVTMQVYLLLPVIVWLVRKTRGHHVTTLVVALVVQLVVFAGYKYFPASDAWLHGYQKQFFFSYVFFIVSGAIAADHADAFLRFIRVHRRAVLWAFAGVGALTLGVWALQVALGQSLYAAGTPLQPIQAVWSTAVFVGFLAIGARWADRRRPGSPVARFVDYASDRSFGIFLSHPFLIWILLYGDSWLEAVVPRPWLTLVTYLLVVVLSVAVTEAFRWTPLSVPLTGRPSLASRAQRQARATRR